MTVKSNLKVEIVAENPFPASNSDKQMETTNESPSTPVSVVKVWQQEDLLEGLDIPENLKKAIQSSLDRIWLTANRLASSEVAKLEQQVADLQEELAEAHKKNAEVRKELSDILALIKP
ncbi:DNA-binding protein [Oceanospirillum sediminis]|uniref:DNA-binding protein n=1 Tax=Oceanospirillum sediminis TaxID=2760088 RepID=A0A839IPV1_9GAMM|nr:DNA-binding protein [Oceanospirillum sediminis]MBB1486704.1 DNA-binding protein [Oceanospirillum sediminis]